jgi:hypothetical protein
MINSVYSIGLLIFSIVIIMTLIFNEDTNLAKDMHPALAFVTIWAAITWLTMIKGGQGSLVGLAPVSPDLYKDAHKLAYRCTQIAHKGDNLDRYLMGRQFMNVLMVFTINLSGGPVKDAEVFGLPFILTNIFLASGLAMTLYTCMVDQLNSQVNGCHCILDYINNYFALFTIWVAMGIVFSGLLHCRYLVHNLVSKLSGRPIISQE